MAEVKVKYVPVFIPEDPLNDWEKAKMVTINGVTYTIPIGETVEVPDFVAEVVNEFLANQKKAKDDHKARMNALKEEMK